MNLSRKGKDLVYVCPGPEKIFDGAQIYSRCVTLEASIPRTGEVDNQFIEIAWEFEANRESYNRLQAYKLVYFGKDLKIKIEDCGDLVIETRNCPYIRAKILLDPNLAVRDVIAKVLYVLRGEEIESIIMESIWDLRDKIGKGE